MKERNEHTSAYFREGLGGGASIVAFCNECANSSSAAKAAVARFEEDDDDVPGVDRSDNNN